ncbi:PHP domain-containing protein [Bacillus sp. JJ1122]|uniref:PHP domain-containing protein n=1 Tax=Bacillus sp. JJ1122 TaxID=3122951 RepID=UPI002FFE61DC
MEIKVELHTHTHYSHDSFLNRWLYLFILKIRKIKVVGITDHNEIIGAKKFEDFLVKFGIIVIVGEEVFTSKGEVIGLFLNEKINPGLTPRETMLEIRRQGGIVYVPHPYDEKRYKTVLHEDEIRKNIDLIDIIEIHNGRNIKRQFSDIQLDIANNYRKIKSVGSDAHTFIELGRNYNLMKEFNNKEEFLNNLNYANYVKADCIQLAHEITKLVRIVKLLRKGRFDELFRIIHKRYRRSKHQLSSKSGSKF